jgi:predicted nucleotidyltransferase component of viral defense system
MAAFEPFLARIQSGGDERWLLKGGFALQLRLGNKARVTKDVDLGANLAVFKGLETEPQAIGEALAEKAAQDQGDFFVFRVRPSKEISLKAGPVRAFRYPVEALLADKPFENFHVDAGVGDPLVAPAVELASSGILDFADLPRPTFKAVPPQQHFAEKVHALTRTWEGVENTRTRDLVDLMLLLDLGLPPGVRVREAIEMVFQVRSTHAVPHGLVDPPTAWEVEYARLAAELSLRESTVASAMSRLRTYWKELGWPEK